MTTDASEIAASLIGVAAKAAFMAETITVDAEAEWLQFRHIPKHQVQFAGLALELIEQLERALSDADWQPQDLANIDLGGRWSLGVSARLRGAFREIHGGFLRPVASVPLVTNLPKSVVLYLAIAGEDDYIEGESHDRNGLSWHYHYFDWKQRRSNVIICWDTRWGLSDPHTRARTHKLS